MLRKVFDWLGRLYTLLVWLVITAFLAVLTWGAWLYYGDKQEENQFRKEGRVVQVTVDEVDHQRRRWLDEFGMSSYVSFDYRGKPYTLRIGLDTAFVSSGDRLRLVYHPGLDAFRQQEVVQKFTAGRVVSRLVNWSVVSTFNQEYKALFFFLAMATATFFCASSVLVLITGLTIIRTVARLALVVVLGAAAVFFTYDTIEYYRYFQHIRSHGNPMDVTVLETDRRSVGRSTRSGAFKTYEYRATVQYGPQERVIPISADDYETLKPKDRLPVLYDASVDDLVPPTYRGDFGHLIAALFFWALFLWSGWSTFFRKQSRV